MAAMNEAAGWTLSFPQTLFDLPVEEIAAIAAEYRPDATDDDGR